MRKQSTAPAAPVLLDGTKGECGASTRSERAYAQERFKLAQEATGVGIWEWDIPGDVIVWDEYSWRMLGYNEAQGPLSFDQWLARLHPDDRSRTKRKVSEQLATGGDFAVEFRYQTVDGNDWLWVQGRGRVLERDADCKPLFMTGTHTNVHKERVARDQLQAVTDRFIKIAEHVPGMLYQFQVWPDGRSAFPFASAGISEIYGLSWEMVENDASIVFERLHPDDLPRVRNEIKISTDTLADWHSQYRVNLPDGGTIWVEGESSPTRQADGSTLWHGYIRDITIRKELESELTAEKGRLQNIIWGTAVGTWEWNVQTGETRFNERWAEIIGYTLPELEPVSIETWCHFAHPDDLGASATALERHFAGEVDTYETEARMRHKDGHWVWVLDRGRIVSRTSDGLPEWMAGTHLDITARKTAELRLSHLAHYDSLTGLPRRILLQDRMKLAMASARRRGLMMAVGFIDLDGFKAVNDVYSHESGDALLIELAKRMERNLREVDTIARVGGDEFVVVLADLDHSGREQVVFERILKALSTPFILDGQELIVSGSIGVAYYPQPVEVSAELVLHQADQAMYEAKSSGKNTVHYPEKTHSFGALPD